MQQIALTAASEGCPPASFGTTEILLPGVGLFQDLVTEKADRQGFVSFSLKFIIEEEQQVAFNILPSIPKH